ncbi:hypothetical protein OX283_003145 [Flavobacterium sp. SUN052]|uniref:hypothetical protein n=1 Tax=Flavobacterium sp. SUN052 TaxID=3002441 RepID=UPI00237EB1D6|nr:hypothetical protein [Flavobacterium sp. SUN052]MEC4003643.1 hypothetical protein [Flavobacterium sp. SUN052]
MKKWFLFLLLSPLTYSQEKIILDSIAKYEGQEITICERVTTTFKSHHNYITFLNFGEKAYPDNKFTIIIKEKHLKNFSYNPMQFLLGKTICVTATVKMYKGKPEFIIKREKDITIIN